MQEFVEFLRDYRPYDALSESDLSSLAGQVQVEFVAGGSVVVRAGQPVDHMWVVRAGRLEELEGSDCVDLIEVGDTFGYTALLGGQPAPRTVRALEDCLLYLLPHPQGVLADPAALRFDDFSGHLERERIERLVAVDRDRLLVTGVLRPMVTAAPADLVADVARRITEAGQSCAVIETPAGLGIVTDSDMRSKVATGDISIMQPVIDLATVPAATIDRTASTAGAFMKMLRDNIKHLIVTEDDRPIGIARFADVAPLQLRDPMVVRTAVERASSMGELRTAIDQLPRALVTLFDHGVAPMQIGGLQSAVIDAVIARVIALHEDQSPVDVRPALAVLGSMARREPLPGSDIDTALVIPQAAADVDEARRYARRLLDAIGRGTVLVIRFRFQSASGSARKSRAASSARSAGCSRLSGGSSRRSRASTPCRVRPTAASRASRSSPARIRSTSSAMCSSVHGLPWLSGVGVRGRVRTGARASYMRTVSFAWSPECAAETAYTAGAVHKPAIPVHSAPDPTHLPR